MTLHQAMAFGLIGLTIAGFVWGRFRYDLISLVSLLAAVALGLVPARKAFDGFSNEVVVIIACALVVSAGFARSGVIEALMRSRSRCWSRPPPCCRWPPRTSARWRS
jgi:uncharacterized membrane protein (UPF0136 family)